MTAPTRGLAEQVAKEAERQRKLLAEKWLGKELPAWKEQCPIKITPDEKRTGGATTFVFAKSGLEMGMNLFGKAESLVTHVLPHEVTHCVVATAVGKPIPRWADEGLGVLAETAEEQAAHDRKCREFLDAGRGFRLPHLFKMKDYPRDTIVLFAQGHSVCRFLLARRPRLKPEAGSAEQALMRFVTMGMETGWDKAAEAVYGFNDVSELEEAWLAWLHTPESILGAEKGRER